MLISRLACIIATLCTAILPVMEPIQLSPVVTDDELDPIIIYFFRAHGCSYCEEANLFLNELIERYPQIEKQDFDVYMDVESRQLYSNVLDFLERSPQGMPTIIISNKVWVGFSDAYRFEIEETINTCITHGCPDVLKEIQLEESYQEINQQNNLQAEYASQAPLSINLPFFGDLKLTSLPLFLSTLVISFVDGFNPCSLWVLSVLLSLALHTRSRKKILQIGLVFLSASSLIYALFISGLFTVVSIFQYRLLFQILTSLTALLFGILNLKDFFVRNKDRSMTISDEAKPKIYKKMRGLIFQNNRGVSLFIGTIVLAFGVSIVEFSCTAGLPMVWTNVLAQFKISTIEYILLLTIYLLVYMIDELVIFLSVVFSMQAFKLAEKQALFTKLLSGIIMILLASIMLFQPDLMQNLTAVLALFVIAVSCALIINRVVIDKKG